MSGGGGGGGTSSCCLPPSPHTVFVVCFFIRSFRVGNTVGGANPLPPRSCSARPVTKERALAVSTAAVRVSPSAVADAFTTFFSCVRARASVRWRSAVSRAVRASCRVRVARARSPSRVSAPGKTTRYFRPKPNACFPPPAHTRPRRVPSERAGVVYRLVAVVGFFFRPSTVCAPFQCTRPIVVSDFFRTS